MMVPRGNEYFFSGVLLFTDGLAVTKAIKIISNAGDAQRYKFDIKNFISIN